MIHHYSAIFKEVLIRPLERTDIELLRNWRNDTEKSKFLCPVGYIDKEMQEKWFENYIKNERSLIFAIEELDDLKRVVGSLSLYNWDKSNHICEIGKIQIGDSAAHGRGIGRNVFVMAMKIAFRKLGIQKIISSVHPDNIPAYRNYMKIGFTVIGNAPSVVSGEELLLEICEETVCAKNNYYSQIELSIL